MRWKYSFLLLVASLLSSALLHADCIKKQDHRSNKSSGVVVTDLIISGTQTLGSDELSRIKGQLVGGC